jgi:glycosyltransferase involved in cell wall biosynthesis
MQLTQIISHYVPAHRFGGPLQVAHGLGKALVARGHSVSVCTTNLADADRDLDVPLDTPVNVDGVSVYYEPTCCSRYWGFSPRLWRRANREIAKADVALVHFHYQFANWAGARLARRHQKPYALFAHGSFKKAAVKRKGRWKKNLYLKCAEGLNLRNANWLFFNAPEERRESMFSAPGRILPSGIDLQEFDAVHGAGTFRSRFPQLHDKLVVLFLGRVDFAGKGLDQLLPAFHRFVQATPKAHLVIAGADERGGLAQVESLVDELKLSPHVTITGLLRETERIAALRESDMFVLPSPSEGLSIALLEALYVGLPVIVTDRVGFCDQVRSCGAGIVTKCDPEALLAALSTLASAEIRSPMRGRATALVRREHSWSAVAEQLLEYLKENPA